MHRTFCSIRSVVLFALTLLSPLATMASIQEEFLTFGEPQALSDEKIVTQPSFQSGGKALQYDDTSWKGVLFRSPLLTFLSLLINEDGSIGPIEVVASSGNSKYDEAIANQMRNAQRRFNPGTVRGKPAAMRYLYAASYVPEGKQEAYLKKKEAVAGIVETWTQQHEAELAQLRSQAHEEQQAERSARRARYPQEAPYRILPSTPVSDSQLATRILKLRHLLTYCGNDTYHRYGNQLNQYAGGPGFVVNQSDLTPLDRINGYEWKGLVRLEYGLWRFKQWNSTQWSDWSYPSGNSPKIEIQLEKKKGVWNWSRRLEGQWVSCEEIAPSGDEG